MTFIPMDIYSATALVKIFKYTAVMLRLAGLKSVPLWLPKSKRLAIVSMRLSMS